MKMNLKAPIALVLISLAALSLTGCTASQQASQEVNTKAENRSPYMPQNDVEYNNYNAAQKMYDDPNSIIWCTTSFPNNSSPLVTIPIRSKLTSSSVSYFRGTDSSGYDQRSVDGMYHGNPPGYRYGFTPSGDYVDFFGLNVLCSSKLQNYQRQETKVSITGNSDAVTQAQKDAEEALKRGDTSKATQLLQDAVKNAGATK
ncbi:hypothetical protein V6N00_13090 [Tersicoccus sp. MR15.9]|uniref:hypothetical protein n=1 Tax=Tersicoccus mangrovi TaxID=3121635 RepID=UPI002FE69623